MDLNDPTASSHDLQSAIVLHQAGRIEEAETIYRRVLANDPDEADALNLLGVILQNRGELDRSIELITRALAVDPDFPEALANLARAQVARGLPGDAAVNAARAEELDEELAEAPLILCRALLALGDAPAAVEAGHRAAALDSRSFEAYRWLGRAQEGVKDWRGAAEAYRGVFELQPHRATMMVSLAAVLSELGDQDHAIGYFRQAAAAAPNELPPQTGLMVALQRNRDIEAAIAAGERALELAPGRADILRVQGNNYDAIGRFDAAETCYQRSLELDPSSAEARRSLARIGRLGNETSEIARLRGVLDDEAAPARERTAAAFGLGILLDKVGAYDAAFASFAKANELDRANQDRRFQSWDVGKFRADIDTLITGFTRSLLAGSDRRGHASDLPVYVVGMFRSGTTLVEQIIASHRKVIGLGETMDLEGIVTRLAKQHPNKHPLLWSENAISRETETHIKHLQDISHGADRVVDKMPDNVTLLGHIALLFPHARIIYCRRDPRDSALSSFFQQFDEPNPWSSDLASCGVRSYEINRLMRHWQEALPLRILEVEYESLVADLEGQSRRLIDFLGLDWDPNCLEYHKTDRTVLSASQWQVRQPVYTTSVGRWRNYRRHLGPLFAELKDLVPLSDLVEPVTERHSLDIDSLLWNGHALANGSIASGQSDAVLEF